MIAQLIPADGSAPITITRDVTLVGRKKGLCDIILDHSSVSKLHCVIARTDGLLFFRDVGSTNGTKVNGQKVLRGALLPGDELAFANVRFQVFLGPGDAPAPPDDRTEMFVLPAEPISEDDMTIRSSEESESDVRISRADLGLE